MLSLAQLSPSLFSLLLLFLLILLKLFLVGLGVVNKVHLKLVFFVIVLVDAVLDVIVANTFVFVLVVVPGHIIPKLSFSSTSAQLQLSWNLR